VNTCLTYLKKESKAPFIHSLDVIEETSISSETENKILELTKEDILELLIDMPQGYKIVFLLSAMDGFSHVEISEKLNITPETSRSQFFRAKKWLVKKFNNSTLIQSYGIF
jgi:RNA polymerase sigma-70 factor (ECF subfamily)